MSDLLIKGVKMPRCCEECPYHTNESFLKSVENKGDFTITHNIVRCEICGAEDPYMPLSIATTKRRDDCPLVEIPPHGRLIDADKLCEYAHNITVGIDANDICRFPCVIESEEE